MYVFAFPTKTSISKKIASGHYPLALRGVCVLAHDFSSQSASFTNVVPIRQRAAWKGSLCFTCFLRGSPVVLLLPWEWQKSWLATLWAQTAQRGRKMSPSSSGCWRWETWVMTAIQWPEIQNSSGWVDSQSGGSTGKNKISKGVPTLPAFPCQSSCCSWKPATRRSRKEVVGIQWWFLPLLGLPWWFRG